MMKNNFLHIPYVCSSQGETRQISSGLIEAKDYVSPNTKTIGTGRTQEYKTSNRGIFFVVGSKQNLTTGSTDHRLSLKEIKNKCNMGSQTEHGLEKRQYRKKTL